MHYDTLVLGGGIVGVSIAVHLQERGRAVALVDRRGPGEETSYGNAGLVERCSLLPVAFPRQLSALAAIVLKRYPGANFHWSALPALAPWLLAYRRFSAPDQLVATARIMQPLLDVTVAEHRRLARAAQAEGFFRDTGWVKIYRTEAAHAAEREEIPLAAEFGYKAREMSREEVLALEPSLKPSFRSGILWSDPDSVSSPGGVTKAYAAYFQEIGGTLLAGDAQTLAQDGQGWSVATAEGAAGAREAVVALGPWSMDVLSPLGYRLPLAVKRGYHMHYHAEAGAGLSRPVLDEEGGYAITPMLQGIRLTTGAEFARRDAPKTPVQVDKAERIARSLFPLAGRAEAEPWMGARPIFPDSRPVIGPAPRHRGLWLAFGHQHLGFTLGPATGRLLAEMMTGEKTFVDAAPFAATRFG
ncbi:NAD(P)/FAD-dependent oxidoreductase [Labrys monachus]|uniref:D-amino-acid dehydrogenase n=1 Tax=Labrys monachus TaxID=217067 RepID=A0ABU0FMS5_9HYPH|nr:FAD-binding oxidoreductase [Labrys monachus]MDQ0395915.1 D-amino-acid dehydrogenase [Labrys monachus]